MKIEKNTTAEEIAKMHASLLERYVKSSDEIKDVSDINDAATESVKENITDFLKATTPLGSRNQIELLGFIERMIASSYLAAVAELIREEQKKIHN